MSYQTIKILELNIPSSRSALVYTEPVMQKAIDNYTNPIVFCSFESVPPSDSATHLVKNLRIENGWVLADMEELDTPWMKIHVTSSVNFFIVGQGDILDGNIITNYTINFIRSEFTL